LTRWLRRSALLVGAVALADCGTALIANVVTLPFWLDSWATSLGVIVADLPVGIVGGVLYNLITSVIIWGPGAWIWSLASILVACSTWFFLRLGWVDIERPFRLVAAGVSTGIANACLAVTINALDLASTPFAGGEMRFDAILAPDNISPTAAALIRRILIEVPDKTVSLIAAAALAVLFEHQLRDVARGTRDRAA